MLLRVVAVVDAGSEAGTVDRDDLFESDEWQCRAREQPMEHRHVLGLRELTEQRVVGRHLRHADPAEVPKLLSANDGLTGSEVLEGTDQRDHEHVAERNLGAAGLTGHATAESEPVDEQLAEVRPAVRDQRAAGVITLWFRGYVFRGSRGSSGRSDTSSSLPSASLSTWITAHTCLQRCGRS